MGWFVVRPVNRVLGVLLPRLQLGLRLGDSGLRPRPSAWCLRLSAIVLLVYVGLIGLTGFGFSRIPVGFIPMQDKGYLVTNIQLPDSASLERTLEVTDKVEKIALETPGVAHTLCLPGMSYVLNANSSSYSNVFIIFKPFHDRRDHELGGDAIAAKIRERVTREIPEARILVFGAPPISGLGTSAGFKLMVEGIGDVDFDALQARADELAAKGNQQPGLVGLFNGFRARTPQLYVDIDREKARSMGVPLTEVFDALQGYLGSSYVNDFNRFGRTWQVNVQADAPFRTDAETIKQLKVRNADGDMVPLGAVADVRDSAGPVQITRYNMYPTASINGIPLPGTSMGDALATMEKLSQDLPRNMTTEWTEVSYLQKQASKLEQFRDLRNIPFSAFGVGVVLVFFVLAGLYESWSLPWAVILVVPMCLLSALCGLALYGMDVNIFVQVGFVVLVGPGGQERHPHRPVRPRPAAGRRQPVRRGRGGRPRAAAADPDDVVRVHPGRLPAGNRRGGRARDAADAGHRGVLRHDRRDGLRPVPDAAVLLRRPVAGGTQGAGAAGGGRRDPTVALAGVSPLPGRQDDGPAKSFHGRGRFPSKDNGRDMGTFADPANQRRDDALEPAVARWGDRPRHPHGRGIWSRRGAKIFGFWKGVAVMMIVTVITAAMHLLAIALWAVVYLLCGEITTFETAFYFSARKLHRTRLRGSRPVRTLAVTRSAGGDQWPAADGAIDGGHVRGPKSPDHKSSPPPERSSVRRLGDPVKTSR